jgi:hypothetical protein
MRCEQTAVGGGKVLNSRLVSIAWSLIETEFNLEMIQHHRVNRLDRIGCEQLWSLDFGEAYLPRVTRTL